MTGSSSRIESKKLVLKIGKDFDKIRGEDSDFQFLLGIVRDLYNNSERTIFELAQNADDAGATSFQIYLESDCLTVWHNGKPFDEKDVVAICGVGKSNKELGSHIGFMGLGFKSTFFISEYPEVYSKHFSFSFDDKTIRPNWIDEPIEAIADKIDNGYTVIRLPFDKEATSLYSDIRRVAARLSESFFALLKNVRLIEFSDTNAVLYRSELISKDSHLSGTQKLVFKTKYEGKKAKTRQYIMYQRTIEIPSEINKVRRKTLRIPDIVNTSNTTTINLLGHLDNRGRLIFERSPLYLYFPLEIDVGFGIIISAEFIPDKRRREIRRNNKWNRWLIWQIGDAIRDFTIELVTAPKYRSNAFIVLPQYRLPYHNADREIQDQLIESTIEHLEKTDSILTMQRSYAKSSEILILPPKTARVFSTRDFAEAIYSQDYIISSTITGRGFLRNFLYVDDVDEITAIKTVLKKKELLVRRPPSWFSRFYHLLSDRKDQIKEALMKNTFILTIEKEVETPSAVHLPSGRQRNLPSGLPGISIAETEGMDEKNISFLEGIGVTKISHNNLVLKILGLCKEGVWQNWEQEKLVTLCRYVSKFLERRDILGNTNRYPSLVELISYLPIPVKIKTKKSWALARNTYLPKSKYTKLLDKPRIIDKKRLPGYLYDHRREIGVNTSPAVIEYRALRELSSEMMDHGITATMWWNYLNDCREFYHYTTWEEVDFKFIDGFEEILQSRDKEKIRILFSLLTQSWEKYKPHLTTRWRGFYQIPRGPATIDSYLAYRLKTAQWIPVGKEILEPSGLYLPLKKLQGLGKSVKFIPRNFIDQEANIDATGYKFFKHIGIVTDPSVDDFMKILTSQKKVSLKSAETIYKLLAEKSIDELEGRFEDPLPRHLFVENQTDGSIKLVPKKAKNLYYFYDKKLASKLTDTNMLAWIPEGVSLPDVLRIFNAFKVKRGTRHIKRRMTKKGLEVEGFHSSNIMEKAFYLRSALLHHGARPHDSQNYLENVNIVFVDFLEIEIQLHRTKNKMAHSAFCDVKESMLYLTPEATNSDIARELLLSFDVQDSPGNLILILNSNIDLLLDLMESLGINLIEEIDEISDTLTDDLESYDAYNTNQSTQDAAKSKGLVLNEAVLTEEHTETTEPIPLFEPSTQSGQLRLARVRTTSRGGTGGGYPVNASMRGRFGEMYVIKWEEQQGRSPVIDRTNDPTYPGYDIESTEEDGSKRFIEVKTWSGSDPELTPNEYRAAMRLKSQYFLYVLTRTTMFIIQDPANSIDITARPNFRLAPTTYKNDEDLIRAVSDRISQRRSSV